MRLVHYLQLCLIEGLIFYHFTAFKTGIFRARMQDFSMLPFYSGELCSPHSKRPVCTIETIFITFTLALACFSTLAVNEFVIHARFVQKGFPYRNVFFSSLTLQDLVALGPSVLLAPKYVLPDRQHLESVAQGLTMMGELSLINMISWRKAAVLQNWPYKFHLFCHISAPHTFQSLSMHSQTLYLEHPLVTKMSWRVLRKQHPEIIKAWIL